MEECHRLKQLYPFLMGLSHVLWRKALANMRESWCSCSVLDLMSMVTNSLCGHWLPTCSTIAPQNNMTSSLLHILWTFALYSGGSYRRYTMINTVFGNSLNIFSYFSSWQMILPSYTWPEFSNSNPNIKSLSMKILKWSLVIQNSNMQLGRSFINWLPSTACLYTVLIYCSFAHQYQIYSFHSTLYLQVCVTNEGFSALSILH